MKNLNLKTAVITGGTKGIGAAIAGLFHSRGLHVVVGARRDNGFVRKLGKRAFFVKMDVRKEEGHGKLLQLALKNTGRADVYVNCAGFSQWKSVEKITGPFLDEMLEVNLKGAFWGCRAAARHMTKGGVIINISSLAGKRGSVHNAAYCMSKFGVTGLTQSLAKELGPRGIRVNAVCPAYVPTDGVLQALEEKYSPAEGGDVPAYLKAFARTQAALQRLPTAREVAQLCWFLASDEASAITGQSINVDCGVYPQ